MVVKTDFDKKMGQPVVHCTQDTLYSKFVSPFPNTKSSASFSCDVHFPFSILQSMVGTNFLRAKLSRVWARSFLNELPISDTRALSVSRPCHRNEWKRDETRIT